jgi:energy-converting hydrogenase Eha subunit B
MTDLQKGDRVLTPGGPGSILYKRMAAPDFATVAAYSVDLDARASHLDPTYAGTVYPAADVTREIQLSEVAVLDGAIAFCKAKISIADLAAVPFLRMVLAHLETERASHG